MNVQQQARRSIESDNFFCGSSVLSLHFDAGVVIKKEWGSSVTVKSNPIPPSVKAPKQSHPLFVSVFTSNFSSIEEES